MTSASVGDDVYRQDRATNALQERIAKLAGKEAALFCVTGTMTNRGSYSCHAVVPLAEILFRTCHQDTPYSATIFGGMRLSCAHSPL